MNHFKTAGILLLVTLLTFSLAAQSLNQSVLDAEGKAKLLGPCNRAGLEAEPYGAWFQSGYEAYVVDSILLQRCEGSLTDLQIEVFLGTWCGDSRREVPRFFKVLDQLALPETALSLVALDNGSEATKQSPSHEEVGKLIHRVPTFIVYRNGAEIGRIVETPHTSFEMDLTQIVLGVPSAPNYKIVARLDQLLTENGIPTEQQGLVELARMIQHDSWNDRELNTYAYVLMARKELDKAIAVLTINAMLYRSVPNVWDSLGEALALAGQLEQAIQMYERVLSLDPTHDNAQKQLVVLREKL